ncbi:MAG: hypothetical protein CMJ76_01260 [Planctomycetaceae bacterium]|nr:hypothetical protein [Planctomycetaceae bacterium]
MSNNSNNEERPGFGRWVIRFLILGLLVGGGVAGVYFLPDTLLSKEVVENLTYKVTRGPIKISVTEQGTLESSDNTEIKCKVRGRNTVTWVVESGAIVKEGDELVRLDTKVIEENLSLQKTNVHEATATLEETKTDTAQAQIAIDSFEEGRYTKGLKSRDAEVQRAQINLDASKDKYEQYRQLFKRGRVSELELDGSAFTVTQAELQLKVAQTRLDVYKRYTRAMDLEQLKGRLNAHKSKLSADEAGLKMDMARRSRAETELGNCVITAPKDGLVIYPRAAAWKDTPDIGEGVSISHDQILLIMPDLDQMQIEIGIHEAIVDRINVGLEASVILPDLELKAKVSEVATIAQPLGPWSGNVVKYDTIISLPNEDGLKPGMSAEVEVVLAEYEDVLYVPVSAILETEAGHFCWIEQLTGKAKRQRVILGESNDVYVIVEQGIKEGDQVLLNPLEMLEQTEIASTDDYRGLSDSTGYDQEESVVEEPVTDE